MKIIFTLPFEIVTANRRPATCWQAHKAAKENRFNAMMITRSAMHRNGFYPSADAMLKVTMMRVHPGMLDDDNLGTAFKAYRDGVSDALNRKTNDSKNFEWIYEQTKNGREKSTLVVIEEMEVNE